MMMENSPVRIRPAARRYRPLARALMMAGWTGAAASGAWAADAANADGATGAEQVLAPVEIKAARDGRRSFAPVDVGVGPYRGQDIVDVPATVNVVTRAVLDAQGDRGLYDALRNVPGVSRQQLNGLAYDNLSVRGIPLDNRSSYLIDGVLPFDNNIAIPMEDKERVEVLKGASALYFGFVPPAGVVNLVMKRAGDKPVTNLTLGTDSNGSALAHVDVGRRFGADRQFGVRINAVGNHVEAPIDGDRGHRNVFAAAFDWRVTNRLKLQYDFEQIDQRIVEQAGIVPLAAKNGVITLPALPDPSRLLVPGDQKTRAWATTHLLRADYAFSDNWSATLTAGQSTTWRDRRLWMFQKYNVATGAGTLQESVQDGQKYENRNVRLDVNGAFRTGFVSHDVTLGVAQNWLHQPSFTTYYYTARQNLYAPVDVTSLTPAGSKGFNEQNVVDRGVYAFDRMSLTSRLDVIAGARYGRFRSSQLGTPTSETSHTSPTASVIFKLTRDTSVYASYVEGLESAGTAPATAANAYQALPAAVSRQQEIGVRSRIAGNTLASLAFFNLRQASAGTDANNVYAVNGNARFRGLEFSLQGDVTRQLSVLASAVWLNARQTDSTDPTRVGRIPENTPRVMASLFVDYLIAAVPGLSVNGGLYYTGPRAVNSANQAWIGGYTLLTGGARYTAKLLGKRVTLQANLENATNKRYWSAAGSNQLGMGLPRTLALSSTVEF
ncbi:TonB-dependent siderophore receptor [Burkholderia metallica]|uniref:TonB-dependent siderophore receptor n=1 Tax=Burkholderia metallica TaxID=488729 RepID=UPI001575A13F|nr:TonB-dependent siderophore receptor [Burkholderia metallica]NTZ10283.1 TonB-dependent siderophore receptor [Burkholderia metallica]